MTREEVDEKVVQILREQLGLDAGEKLIELGGAKNLQEAIMCTSLDTVSIQIACEEAFGMHFASGVSDRGPIDEEWEQVASVGAITDLVMKWRKP